MIEIVNRAGEAWDRTNLTRELAEASSKLVAQAAEIERLQAALAVRPIKPRHHPEKLRKLTGEDGYHKGWQEALTALGNARAALAEEKA